MIDIHSHILPGIDDGAKSEADSLAMARAAVEEGIHALIATPHHKNGVYENNRTTILTHTEILNALLEQENIPLTILPGQETRINGEMTTDIENGELLPLNNTKYLFVELPTEHIPRYAKQMLFDIQVTGYTPIIVHPERNEEIIENPDKLYDFVQKGALTQVTAGSVLGKFGKTVQKVTDQLIEANLTHFIASDAHNTTSRKFWMKDTFEEVREKYGDTLYYTFLENGELLAEDMNVNRQEPLHVKRKKFLGLF